MINKRKNSIAKKVKSLLEDFGVEEAPVPVERIAKFLDAQLRFSPLDDELSGMVYIKDGVPIIGVNALHHPNRQRFTIAHEIGHLYLHKEQITKEIHVDKNFPTLMRNSVSAAGIDEIEIEANFFAAELLMPEELLAEELENTAFDIDDEDAVEDAVIDMAKRFKVSASAMRYRLGNLFV